MRKRFWLVSLVTVPMLACSGQAPPPKAGNPPANNYNYSYGPATFKDDVKTNIEVKDGTLALVFVDSEGKPVDLKKYEGKKNVVLVVTRGFPGYVCPNCSAQTSRLIANYQDFAKRDAEVLVVFPGSTQRLGDFVQASKSQAANAPVPFPILLDENFKAVDHLGIRGDLAKPATYIVDKKGKVVFAYVGTSTADRPSLKAMLDQLDRLGKS